MREIAGLARDRGLAVHLDGARLPNAAAATGSPMRAWAEHADTVMVALSKGLGAPVGSLLAGTGETMERAWRIRRRLGGGMRQAGILAAAGLYALHHHLERLPEDHRRAARLARLAAAVPGLLAREPETNIVMIDLQDGAPSVPDLLARLEARGVRMTPYGPRRVRAILHLDVGDEMVERAGAALAEAVGAGHGGAGGG
jgi:threonine aldolase